ncbi:unnamed protein product [Effrenium voratum]|uniref:Uncharacterized protein n=1 Tax=Effrenium voratum TaxID=2562239 RepID=A0AA36HZ20_9DINO|nr:unnamed protein product [Effrenium voratum]
MPVMPLPQPEAEHYVIHSDASTPSVGKGSANRRVSASVRRRRSEVERKSPLPERRRSLGVADGQGAALVSTQRSASVNVRSSLGRETSPTRERPSRPKEPETKESKPTDDASPNSLRREIDVLRLQVSTLREVQEQTAEIHWKVISNMVEERNLWEKRCREAEAVKTETAEATGASVPGGPSVTASAAPSEELRPERETLRSVVLHAPMLTPSFCRGVVQPPKMEVLRQSVDKMTWPTRYTLPTSSLWCYSQGLEGLASRSQPTPQLTPQPTPPKPQPQVMNCARLSDVPMIRSAVRMNAATVATPPIPGKEPADLVATDAKVRQEILKVPTPCRRSLEGFGKENQGQRREVLCSRCGARSELAQ